MANVLFKRGGLEGCGLFPGLLSENRYVCARKVAKVRASLVAQMVKNLRAIQETQAQSLGREDPVEDLPLGATFARGSTAVLGKGFRLMSW